VTIPIGAASVTIDVVLFADSLPEGVETVELTVGPDTARYAIATAAVTLTITDLPVDDWRHRKFGGSANNPAIAGDLADPDGDGLANLLEYGFNTNPLDPNPGPALTFEGPDLVLTYRRCVAATDVTFDIRASSDLTTWSDANETEQVLTDDGITRVIRAKLPYEEGGQHCYRIEVTRPAQ
jgi:hypothetical protein